GDGGLSWWGAVAVHDSEGGDPVCDGLVLAASVPAQVALRAVRGDADEMTASPYPPVAVQRGLNEPFECAQVWRRARLGVIVHEVGDVLARHCAVSVGGGGGGHRATPAS